MLIVDQDALGLCCYSYSNNQPLFPWIMGMSAKCDSIDDGAGPLNVSLV